MYKQGYFDIVQPIPSSLIQLKMERKKNNRIRFVAILQARTRGPSPGRPLASLLPQPVSAHGISMETTRSRKLHPYTHNQSMYAFFLSLSLSIKELGLCA